MADYSDYTVKRATISLTDTTETTLIAAVAGMKNVIRQVYVTNDSSTTVRVDFRDTTGGSVIFHQIAPAANPSGATESYWEPAAKNTNWTAKLSASPSGGNGTLYVDVVYEVHI